MVSIVLFLLKLFHLSVTGFRTFCHSNIRYRSQLLDRFFLNSVYVSVQNRPLKEKVSPSLCMMTCEVKLIVKVLRPVWSMSSFVRPNVFAVCCVFEWYSCVEIVL